MTAPPPRKTCWMELYDLYCRHPRISTDSRRVQEDSLFFALRGENFDGNRYAADALEAGAAAAVVDDARVIDRVDPRRKRDCILVPDGLQALQQLAAEHRRRLGVPILAITGSNGKTTTKELLGRTLSHKYRTVVTRGNLNNHIGVPLTLLAMDSATEFGLVEMGASHCGEIALLCSIARPDYGLITNIGKAHLEGFGGIAGVMRGKGELLDELQRSGGTAFYLSDSDWLCEMVAARPQLKTVPYSARGLTPLDDGVYAGARWNGRTIRTQLVGAYNLNNIAAAIAAGTYFGVEPDGIVAAIESYEPDNNRSQKRVTPHNTLILDAYNANPSSMRAALENFAGERSSQPKAAILGDMRELGSFAATEHEAVVGLLRQSGIDEAYLVGPHFTAAAGGSYPTFADADALGRHLDAHPLRGRLILVKGSRGICLETVAEKL